MDLQQGYHLKNQIDQNVTQCSHYALVPHLHQKDNKTISLLGILMDEGNVPTHTLLLSEKNGVRGWPASGVVVRLTNQSPHIWEER